ncbi:MAG TPA: lipopolysaccharide biosynthesis protein [Solirubrobacteraceae bacterium]
MRGYLKRLLRTGAAYQAADIAAKAIALFTLPLYTRHVSSGEYGAYNSLLTAVILSSIFLRVGLGEAFVRFYFEDEDPVRRARIARTATATVAWTTTLAALLALAFAAPLSRLLLGQTNSTLLDCAVLGLWAFTNLEMAYAQLRVDERVGVYLRAAGANVAMTVTFTIALVVFAGEGARGLLLGNFGASAIVVLGLWWVLRARFSLRAKLADLRAMLHFGLPTIPADASVYGLQVADRLYIYRGYSHAAAGQYSIALQLATVVFVFVRGFQYAWPPLAYSVKSDRVAARLYALVTTFFVLATGTVVCAVALLGRWLVRLLAAPEYFGAHAALPWLALGWTLYGLYQVLIVITGRARATRLNLPAALAGLAVNIALLLLLVPNSGAGLGIAGAGIALCGAYVAMLAALRLLTRRVFPIAFDARRLTLLVAILGGVAVSGELMLPTAGFWGLALRVVWLAWIPALLILTRFFVPTELTQARLLLAAARHFVARARRGAAEAYAEDPLRDL